MTLDMETYKFTDGKTPLSAESLNPRFYSIVRRLHALETVVIDWTSAVSQVQNYGLKRINEAIVPLVEGLKLDIAALIAEGDAQIAAQASALAEQLGRVDARIAAVQVLGQQEAWGPAYAAVTATIAYVGPQEILVDAVSPDLATGVHVQADCGADGYRFGRILSATVAAGKTTVRCDWYEGSLTPALKAFTTLGESRLIYVVDLATPVAAAAASAEDAATARSDAVAARDVTRTYRDAAATAAAQAIGAANSFAAFRDELGIFPGLIRPTLNLHCASMADDSVPLGTFTRSTPKTRRGPTGLLETVAAGLLARDWSAEGALPGWLLEEMRTNYYVGDPTGSIAVWTTEGASLTQGFIAPDGTPNGVKITATATTALAFASINVPYYTVTDDYYPMIFLKRGNQRYATLNCYYGELTETNAFIDFDNETIINQSYPGEFSIEKFYADWFRIGYRMLRNTSGSNKAIYTRVWPNHRALLASGDYCYAFGQSLEHGAFPTSYIYPGASAVTRPSDVWMIPTITFPFNVREGTLFAAYDQFGAHASPDWPAVLAVGGTSNGFMELYDWGGSGVNSIGALARVSGHNDVSFYKDASARNARIKSALSYTEKNTSFSVNGSPAISQDLSSLPTMQTVYVGCNDSGRPINGHLYHACLFPRSLSNANLQLSTM